MAASGTRAHRARPVHRDRRGERHDRVDRAVGPARDVRAGRTLAARGLAPTTMFFGVNVSAREVQQPGFVERRSRCRPRDGGLEPTNLVLEITETALLQATPATIATLGRAARARRSGPSSTTSGRATSRSATCASSRSTSSRSPASSSRMPTPTRSRRRWHGRSSRWAARCTWRRSPRDRDRPAGRQHARPSAAPTARATTSATRYRQRTSWWRSPPIDRRRHPWSAGRASGRRASGSRGPARRSERRRRLTASGAPSVPG